MSEGQIGSLVVAAIIVFWMVGAYNRLVALRSVIGSTFGQVDEVLQRRGAAAVALAGVLRPALTGEQGALDALLAAQAQVRAAADVLRTRPVMRDHASALVLAEASMSSASSRVLALLEQHPALLAGVDVAPPVATLRESAAQLAYARQVFNDAALTYNAAARQFPTRLLARLYGFGTAGRI